MDTITEKLLALLPEQVDPDTVLPDIYKIQDRLQSLTRQSIVVNMLLWTLENKDWLPSCNFQLYVEDNFVYLAEDKIVWEEGVSEEWQKRGVDQVPEIQEYLNHEMDDGTEETIRRILDKMNAASWAPDKAFDILVNFAPNSLKGSKEEWLGQHKAHFEANQLKNETGVAPNPGLTPRRRM